MTTRTELITAIGTIADQIDAHYGNPPGTAIRGIYFWFWPAADCGQETLEALYRDAVEILAELTAPDLGAPCELCSGPLETADAAVRGTCERCQPVINGLQPQQPNRNTNTA